MENDPPLIARVPWWATRTRDAGYASEWLVAPPLPSGERLAAILLRIEEGPDGYIVREVVPGTHLPGRCPELHVITDGYFCLGFGNFRLDLGGAAAFWQALGEFLVNVDHALRRGYWPSGRWMSHGHAAAVAQLEAEAAAASAGLGEDYAAWLESGEGWLKCFFDGGANPLRALRLTRVCPRGCRDEKGGRRAFLQCAKRPALRRVIAAERRRIDTEAMFWDGLRASGFRCCGRMPVCPARTEAAA